MSLSGTKPYYFKSLRMSFSAARLFLFVWTSTSLPDVARDGDGDQIEAADTAVRWIEGDPARARHIDFRPGMSRPRIFGPHNVLIRIVKIAGDDPCPETDTARRFNEEDREIPAGSPAAIQSLGRRLGALVLPALIADPSSDAGAQVLEQG